MNGFENVMVGTLAVNSYLSAMCAVEKGLENFGKSHDKIEKAKREENKKEDIE